MEIEVEVGDQDVQVFGIEYGDAESEYDADMNEPEEIKKISAQYLGEARAFLTIGLVGRDFHPPSSLREWSNLGDFLCVGSIAPSAF